MHLLWFQAALYPTGSEDQPEDPLTWEPGEMEFDDEFSLPQSTILATLLARKSEEESFTGVPPKLVLITLHFFSIETLTFLVGFHAFRMQPLFKFIFIQFFC